MITASQLAPYTHSTWVATLASPEVVRLEDSLRENTPYVQHSAS